MAATSTEQRPKPLACLGAEEIGFDETLVTAFERAIETFSTNVALSSDLWRPTYRELNATANRLAHRLIRDGGGLGDRVAILMEHDTPAIAANLAIVKAGRIAVVLFAGDPVPRLKTLMADAEPSVLVTDSENRELAKEISGPTCKAVTFEAETAVGPADNPAIAIGPRETAALVYTSGATGRPKAVMYTHRQFRRNAAAHSEAMQYTDADRVPLLSTVATGQGANCVWYTLLNGATLYPFPMKKRGITGLADFIVDRGLTVYVSSASVFRTLVKALDDRFVFSGIRAVRLASESVTADDFRSFRKHFPATSAFVHTLATSETGNIAWSRWPWDAELPDGTLPVGHISRDIEVSLVDDEGAPVPRGEIGELLVKSRHVAAGYWRDPALTAERFSDDLDGRGTRLVRTGDRARFNEAGYLEFRGRKDDRIKIRGNRIELADIERALARLPGIDGAAAVAVPRNGQEPMLVAYVVLTRDATWSVTRLRHAVAANLPLHMVPSRFVFVDALPFGAGGKIDRDALRLLPLPQHSAGPADAPRTEMEVLLADIWAEALELPQVARHDDFFSLGGDSLKGAVVAACVHSAFGVAINLAEIASHPTLAGLAALIEERGRPGAPGIPPILPAPRTGPLPLSLLQERMWRISESRPLDAAAATVTCISGALNIDILRSCLEHLIERHESLRTTFRISEGLPSQTIHPAGPLHFSFVDVSAAAEPEERATSIFTEEALKPVNPGMLPALRYLLVKIRDSEHWLLRIAHALVLDAGSSTILMHELAVLYEARLEGREPPIPKEMPLQYADYAVWQRQVMRVGGPAYQETLNWWKHLFCARIRPVKLPFRRSKPLAGIEPGLGVIDWQLERNTAQRLDQIARTADATRFGIRLTLFVALIADMTGASKVVIGTVFGNRRHIATGNIIGQFSSLVPLLCHYDRRRSFRSWIASVRDGLFETEKHAEIPYEELYEALRAAGLRPPAVRILFALSADRSEQRFGGLTLTRRPNPIGKMPWGCQVYIDEHAPENCRVDFNAGLYDRKGMQAMVDRYVRLLEIASLHPELTIGRLVAMSSDNALRRAIAGYAMRTAERIAAR